MLREALSYIAANYRNATTQDIAGNAVAQFIRGDAAEVVRNALGNDHFQVTGSPGQGNWADVPWIGIFDPPVTTSATRGFYIVYLFAADMAAVYLTLNQGTTSVREEFKSQTLSELRRLAELMRARLPEAKGVFSAEPILLKGRTGLPQDYEAATALSARYDLANLPAEEVLVADLKQMMVFYSRLIARGGRENFEDLAGTEAEETEGKTIEERKRYRQHRKIERAGNAGKLAKKAHGYICHGCGIDFAVIYGSFGKNYIEAHHLTPISELPEDVPVSLNPKNDFAVLCANCHRMVHRKNGPKTINELAEIAGVKEMRKLFETLKTFGTELLQQK
jgi:5-methylcytosine-specific restriction protein A